MITTKISTRIFEDFENYYGRRRILFHIFFWICLLLIFTIDILLVNTGFNFNLSFVLAIREIVQSVFAFYFIGYIVIPYLFIQKYFGVAIIILFVPLIVAPLLNYFTFIILDPLLLRDNVSSEYVKRGLFFENLSTLFTSRSIILSFMPLFLRTMPAFVMKLLVSTVRYFHNSRKQQEREHALERSNLQLEINFLKSQMNPHFFFNTLNNIYSSVYLKDERALDMIEHLSEIMQYTLYSTKEALVPLEQELRFLEHYANLEKTRYNVNSRAVQFYFDYRDMEGQMIAPLLLFPFLENAFKYGIGLNKKTGWLKTKAKMKNGTLYFYVENNKPRPSFQSSLKEKEFLKDQRPIGGIGVSSTVRRLSLLYKDNHELLVDDEIDIYSVSLRLKCRKDEPKIAMSHS